MRYLTDILTEIATWCNHDPTPDNLAIIIVTTKTGTFTVGLRGSGTVDINWGDGVIETVALTSSYQAFTHDITGGSTVTIMNTNNITQVYSSNQSITDVTIPAGCTSLYYIGFPTNSLTSFTTHAEWVNLEYLYLQSNSLTGFNTYSEWTKLVYLYAQDNSLTSLNTYSTWSDLTRLIINRNQLTSLDTFAEWSNLTQLVIGENFLTTLDTFNTWTKLFLFSFHTNQLTSIDTFNTWVDIYSIDGGSQNLGSFDTFNTWTKLYTLNLDTAGLATFAAHPEWIAANIIQVRFNAIISDVDINNILIALDSAGMTGATKVIGLNGGTNAAPTGLGVTAKNNLIARGVVVTTN